MCWALPAPQGLLFCKSQGKILRKCHGVQCSVCTQLSQLAISVHIFAQGHGNCVCLLNDTDMLGGGPARSMIPWALPAQVFWDPTVLCHIFPWLLSRPSFVLALSCFIWLLTNLISTRTGVQPTLLLVALTPRRIFCSLLIFSSAAPQLLMGPTGEKFLLAIS